MARMSGVAARSVTGPRMLRYDLVVLHTIVGRDPADAAHFSVGSYGEITQSRDTMYQSAACYQGNPRCIAIETEDMGAPFPSWGGDPKRVPPWTPQQIEAIAQVIAWCHKAHGIPIVAAPNSRASSRGVAYHRQGVDGNFLAEGFRYSGRVPDGELWTLYPGKACPGDARIDQIPGIIARARVIAGLDQEADDVTLTAEQDRRLFNLDRLLSALLIDADVVTGVRASNGTTGDYPLRFTERIRVAHTTTDPAQNRTLAEIRAAVTASASEADPVAGQILDVSALADRLAGNPAFVDALAGRLASALADQQDRRARDGNAATGPVS